jgi:hypothetical protein
LRRAAWHGHAPLREGGTGKSAGAGLPGSAQRRLSDREGNGTAKHANCGGALQVQDDAFDLQARLAEVEQQAEILACGFQIIQTLRVMNLVDRLGYLQFDEDDVFDE